MVSRMLTLNWDTAKEYTHLSIKGREANETQVNHMKGNKRDKRNKRKVGQDFKINLKMQDITPGAQTFEDTII